MEHFTFTKEDEDTFLLSVFFNYNMYEIKLTSSDLTSDLIEVGHLGGIIQTGLKPSQSSAANDLSVGITMVEADEQSQLEITVDLEFNRAIMKSRRESHKFVLDKKEINSHQTFENIMRGTERTLNLPHIQPNTTNLFILIERGTKHVSYVNEKGDKVALIEKDEFDTRFLAYLEMKYENIQQFYSNKQKSQEAIHAFNQQTIQEMFRTHDIYAVLVNYIAHIYYCNFFTFISEYELMVNVSTDKAPKESLYFIADNLSAFKFDQHKHYRILSQLTLSDKIIVEEASKLQKVKIMMKGGKYLAIINKMVMPNSTINIQNKYVMKTNAEGFVEGFYTKDQRVYSTGFVSPSHELYVATDGNGRLSHMYVSHPNCSGNAVAAACTCYSLSNYDGMARTFQEADPSGAVATQGKSSTLYLIEQF